MLALVGAAAGDHAAPAGGDASRHARSRDRQRRPAGRRRRDVPPIGKDSVKFLVIGDSGTGDRAQNEVGAQMWKAHSVFPYEFAIMLGDNMYGSRAAAGLRARSSSGRSSRCSTPRSRSMRRSAITTIPNQRFYKNFDMGGKRYYTYQKKDVALLRARQQLHGPGPAALARGGAVEVELEVEDRLLPSSALFVGRPARIGSRPARASSSRCSSSTTCNVVFAGHEHFYERIKPQKGIHYFTAGGSAKLRAGDIVSSSALTAKGFDTEQSFMLVEIDGDVLRFQTISRRGKRVDSGEIRQTGRTS